ncbi:MAG TPA: energy transducer TonB [Draconibacterium sp.]|nr:energy transducer TonB [Draconibacterium sp.]
MEQKKSRKADLERKRNTFFLLGLVIALGIVLMAFEFKSEPKKNELQGGIRVDFEDDFVIPPTHEKKKMPLLPKPLVANVITIVPDDQKIYEDPIIEDTEPSDIIYDIPVFIETKTEEPVEDIFVTVQEMPMFPGGERALYQYISKHVNYPAIAQENGIESKVYVQFVVDENGNVINAHVSRPGDVSLDEEAVRVINSLPRFKPGRQNGKYVKVYYTAVINFQLH